MAAFDSSLTYEPFDPNLEATSVDRILRNTWTDSMSRLWRWTSKKRKGKGQYSCIVPGPRLQDMFDALEDTGVRFWDRLEATFGYLEPRKHLLFNILPVSAVVPGKKKSLKTVEAIKEAEPLRNAKELNSFLCTVQYKARFIVSYAPQADTLRDLLKADFFTWKKEHQESFSSLKEAVLRHGPGLFRPQCTAWGTRWWMPFRSLGDAGSAES